MTVQRYGIEFKTKGARTWRRSSCTMLNREAMEAHAREPSDAAVMARWARITDPKEALRVLLKNESFLGYDPYYADLRDALLDMCDRCSQ